MIMEITMNMGTFETLDNQETMNIEGGVTGLEVAAIIVAVCAAGKGCYEIGTYFGKAANNIWG